MALPGYNSLDPNLPPEIAAEQARIARQQAISEAMLQRGMTPLAPQAAPIHWSQGLAQIFNAYSGRKGMDGADQDRTALGQKYQSGLAGEVARIAAIRQGKTILPDPQEIEQASDQGTAEPRPTTTGDPRGAIQAALVSQYAPVRQMGTLEHKTYENEQTKAADREARSYDRLMALEAAAQNQSLAREERAARAAEAAQLRRELLESQQRFAAQQGDLNRDLRRDLRPTGGTAKPKAPVGFRFSSDGETLEPIPGGPKDKPAQLPTQALKLQKEELDAIGTAASINSDLTGVLSQLNDGKLKLGPIRNAAGEVRNFVGASDENSRNLASFKATLEKLRNDSLRLNKGVQTEGDAVRAWNELVKGIKDPAVVKQRLEEVQKINERAVNLRKMNVDAIRSNYGLSAMDTSGYETQPAAIGAGSAGRPAVGAVQNGYRFKGGDPAKQESWEKVP